VRPVGITTTSTGIIRRARQKECPNRQAVTKCQEMGADLVSITDLAEMDFVMRIWCEWLTCISIVIA